MSAINRSGSGVANINSKRDAFFKTDGVAGYAANGGSPQSDRLCTEQNDWQQRSPQLGRPTVKNSGFTRESVIQGYVGFANMPNQLYRKSVKRGFEFTLLVVGQSGLGKTTFVNGLFLTALKGQSCPQYEGKTVEISETCVQMKENGVNLSLTLVDTPGFGDMVDNSSCWNPIIGYIDRRYNEYFNEETKINRSVFIPDRRVHCCLYFIAPTCHGLKPLDIEFMRHLHQKVNIIPVIAKADTMTLEECRVFKQKVLEDIKREQIRVYEFPEDESDSDALKQQGLSKLRMPFAVVGSTNVVDIGGNKVRCRKYPWGIVEVDNLEHNDFIALRKMLIRSHMIDLIDVTRNVHYENFRCRELLAAAGGKSAKDMEAASRDPFTSMEEERQKHEQKVKKTEENLEKVFQEKIQEKQQKITETELKLKRQPEQFKAALDQKRNEVNNRLRQFDADKQVFERQNPEFQRYLSEECSKSEKSSPGSKSSESPKRRNGTGTLSKLFHK